MHRCCYADGILPTTGWSATLAGSGKSGDDWDYTEAKVDTKKSLDVSVEVVQDRWQLDAWPKASCVPNFHLGHYKMVVSTLP